MTQPCLRSLPWLTLLASLVACQGARQNPAVMAMADAVPPTPVSTAPPTSPAPVASSDSATGTRLDHPWTTLASAPGPALPWRAATAHEESEPYSNIYRRFGISVGGAFYGNFNTSMSLKSAAGLGAILDLEDFLDVDSDASVFRMDMHYAFNRRHRIDAAFYDLRRGGTVTVAEDIQIGDTVLPAGPIESSFDTRIFKINYRYNFVADERALIAASFGFHTMLIDTSFKSSTFDVDEQFDAVAPLPLLGLHAAYALDHKWSMSGGVEALRVQIGDFDGLVVDTRLGLDHDTFKHFGWGIGLNSFEMSLKIDQSLDADIEYGYTGVMVYLRSYF